MSDRDDRSDQEEAERQTGARGADQSGGGAYPNPHSGKDGDGEAGGGFLGHGGQSKMDYHGSGRLGKKKTGANANAPAGGTRPGD